jgi:hypothetical protein
MVRTARSLVAVLLVACGSGQPATTSAPLTNTAPPAPPDAPSPSRKEQAFAALQRFADGMCRCTDVDCAQQVSNDMSDWAQEQAVTTDDNDDLRMTEQEQRHATQIATRLGECMQRAMGAAAGQP